MDHNDIKGMIPATILPMDSNYRPNFDAYGDYLEWLIGQNAVAFAINMDTGEGPQLHAEERQLAARKSVQIADGRVKVLAGVMGATTDDAVGMAEMYRDEGVDGLVVFPNAAFRNDPLDPRIPMEYHRAIAEASGLPMVLFQLAPVFGGVLYSQDTLIKLLELPQVVGIKEASFDAQIYASTVKTVKSVDRPLTILVGNDRFIFESILLGAEGALLGFGAIGCKIVAQLLTDVAKGDYQKAVETRSKSQGFMDVIYRDPVLDYRARCKVALAHVGVIPHALTFVRPPLLQIEENESAEIKAALKQVNML